MSEERIAALEARLAAMERQLARGAPTYLGGGEALTRLHSMQPILVDARDMSVSAHLLLSGQWENWVESAIMPLLQPGMSFCDVGAQMGYYTLLGAARIGHTGRLHAFEPNPRAASLLRRSIALNGLDRFVTLHEAAAGAVPGTARLIVDPHFPGGATMARPAQGTEQFHDVPMITLDSVMADVPELHVLKIDAEGAEALVLAGAQGLIARSPKLAIILEFYTSMPLPQGPLEFLRQMQADGFALEVVHPSGVVAMPSPEAILAFIGDGLSYLRFRR